MVCYTGAALKREFTDYKLYCFKAIEDNKLYYITNYNYYTNTVEVRKLSEDYKGSTIKAVWTNRTEFNINFNSIDDNKYYKYNLRIIGHRKENFPIYYLTLDEVTMIE
jgi:hypothetical protein